jgi:hypothetical protein
MTTAAALGGREGPSLLVVSIDGLRPREVLRDEVHGEESQAWTVATR